MQYYGIDKIDEVFHKCFGIIRKEASYLKMRKDKFRQLNPKIYFELLFRLNFIDGICFSLGS